MIGKAIDVQFTKKLNGRGTGITTGRQNLQVKRSLVMLLGQFLWHGCQLVNLDLVLIKIMYLIMQVKKQHQKSKLNIQSH